MGAYTFTEQAETVRFSLGIIAGIVVSLGIIIAPFFRPMKRLWARHRAEADRRRNEVLACTIVKVMRPELDVVRAAARAQHDEQNEKLDAIGEQITELASSHGEHLARHDVEIAVLQARDPRERTRRTDQ
jgi:hypothetical protein